jgi:hypothetical protein
VIVKDVTKVFIARLKSETLRIPFHSEYLFETITERRKGDRALKPFSINITDLLGFNTRCDLIAVTIL